MSLFLNLWFIGVANQPSTIYSIPWTFPVETNDFPEDQRLAAKAFDFYHNFGVASLVNHGSPGGLFLKKRAIRTLREDRPQTSNIDINNGHMFKPESTFSLNQHFGYPC